MAAFLLVGEALLENCHAQAKIKRVYAKLSLSILSLPITMIWDVEPAKHNTFFLPGSHPHYSPDRAGQVRHLQLDLRLDLARQIVQGKCTIELASLGYATRRLCLDAVDLVIGSVRINQVGQKFHYDRCHLVIELDSDLPELLEIEIEYSVERPSRGIYFIAPTADYPDRPLQVWTQGEDEDSRYWFPCFDYPGQLSTSEVRVEIPKGLMAISNGELRQVIDCGDTRIYHWYQPQVHPTYLITLAVGDFRVVEEQDAALPVAYYLERRFSEEAARLTLGKTPRMIEFLSRKYGYPYPFSKYAQVCVADFIFGGMENTSTTLLTDAIVLDQRAAIDDLKSESLVVHELAHQWFGDLVVINHWAHAWLKEGAATYAEVLWFEQEYGEDAGRYYLLGLARNYLAEDAERYRRPMVTNVYQAAIELYDCHIYEKGAWIYHMIRGQLGEVGFERSLQSFLRQFAHGTVETVDLLRAIAGATGKNLTPLFDQYVMRGGYPQYRVTYGWDPLNSTAKLTVVQEQEELFDLQIPIAFEYIGQLQPWVFVVQVAAKQQSFYFVLPQAPDWISFDRGSYHLKHVSLDYPLDQLCHSLHHNSDPIAKIQAAEAIARQGDLAGLQALSQAYQQEQFWGVRLEIITQLGKIKLDQAIGPIALGLQDQHPRVRCAAILALASFKQQASLDLIKPFLKHGDPSYLVEAAAAACIGELAQALSLHSPSDRVFQLLVNTLETKAGWNEVVRIGAIKGMAQLRDQEQAIATIIKYTQPGVPNPLRLSAIVALGTIAQNQPTAKVQPILNQISLLIQEHHFHTKMAVIKALAQIDQPGSVSLLQALRDQTNDGRIKRRVSEALQKVEKLIGSDASVKQIRTEFEQLKQENQDLKSRLAAIEAKFNLPS